MTVLLILYGLLILDQCWFGRTKTSAHLNLLIQTHMSHRFSSLNYIDVALRRKNSRFYVLDWRRPDLCYGLQIIYIDQLCCNHIPPRVQKPLPAFSLTSHIRKLAAFHSIFIRGVYTCACCPDFFSVFSMPAHGPSFRNAYNSRTGGVFVTSQ